MKPAFAVVDDVPHHARAVDTAIIDLRDAERHASAADERAHAAHQVVLRCKRDLGKALIAARKHFPPRGPAPKGQAGWADFCRMRGLDPDVARDHMRYAGAVFEDDEDADLPTRREAGLDERPLAGDRPPRDVGEDEILALLGKLAPEARARVRKALRPPRDPAEGDRDSWCTPPAITAALPIVDLDPCSNPRSTVRAMVSCQLERGEDGLAIEWRGSLWLNVPFGDPLPWAAKFDRERGTDPRFPLINAAGWLCNTNSTTEWWALMIRHLPLRLDLNERTAFVPPPGVKASTNDRPQTLLMDEAFWRGCDQPALLAMGTLWRRSGLQLAV